MVQRRDMRVSDAERQAVVDRLLAAVDEGRLDLQEYDRRIVGAYGAVSYGDLDDLLEDLPPVRPTTPEPATWAVRPTVPAALAVLWAVWLSLSTVGLVLWGLFGLGGGPGSFWPLWVLAAGAPLPGVSAGILAARRRSAVPSSVALLSSPAR
ncbi:DUF1707 SHOCT-like domain-containing protein [Blastococcus deserti]|uniref:DUF1707 domain-containing protein n=1 Tax=Blastococcus deserti TaxID=2259033 RepID=A0ABW4X7I3_9ACTN